MSYRRKYFLIATVLVLGGSVRAQEFPIGAWFPGLFDDQDVHWAARLDAVRAAHFNTISPDFLRWKK